MSRNHGSLALSVLVAMILVGCGSGAPDSTPKTTANTTPAPAATETEPAKAEFAAAADAACIRAGQRFLSLPDPDGPGGAKPIGIGTFMHDMTDELRAVEAPPSIARDWDAGLALLDQAADKLTESELAANAGDLERAGDAQGEALWALEAQAQEHFDTMKVPFRVCFVE